MDFNNFITRAFISIFFLSIYLLIANISFNYIFYLILILYLFIFIEVYIYFKKFKLIIFLYIFISIIFVFNNNFSNDNLNKFNLMLLTIISFDIFSYLIGNIFGRTKFLKFISPNKTLEGLIGGIIFSFLITLLYAYYFNFKINYNLCFIILLFVLSALIGDIIESYFKRKNNLKNSSNFLPGHGGFFDRFDSFIPAIITYSLIY